MYVTTTTSGNFDNTTNWLKKTMNKSPTATLNRIGSEGTASLQRSTPRGETGQTAAGWSHRVESNNKGGEVYFINTAHPHTAVNVAKLIQFGHGTGTGGYVPPTNYIRPALKSTLDGAGDRIAKEMFL